MTEHTWSVYNAPPAAGSMIESLRGLGYSPSTALADLTDNSITAGASQVDLSLVWNDAHPYISLLDNGHGMTKKELFDAMRLGSTLSAPAPEMIWEDSALGSKPPLCPSAGALPC